MFNPYSPSFSGCACKVKKALKLTVTPAVPLKALCPRKNPAKSFPTYKENESKKEFPHFTTAQLFHHHGPGSSVMQHQQQIWLLLLGKSWNIPAGVNSWQCIPCSANAGCNLAPSRVVLLTQPRLL